MSIKRHNEQGWCPKCYQITWQEITEWDTKWDKGKHLTQTHCQKCGLLNTKTEDLKGIKDE